MRHGMRLLRLWLAACTLVLASSCADQQVGERCDFLNGNADCAAGLECVKLIKLNSSQPDGFAVCCPTEGDVPDICSGDFKSGAGGAGSVATPDAGSSQDSGTSG